MMLTELPIVTTQLQAYADLLSADPDNGAYLALRWLKPLSLRDPAIAALGDGIETLSVGRAQITPGKVLIGDRTTAQAHAGRIFDVAIERNCILDAVIFPNPGEITSAVLFKFMMGTTEQGRPR